MKNSNNKQQFSTTNAQLSEKTLQRRLQQLGIADIPFMSKDYSKLQTMTRKCFPERGRSDSKDSEIGRLKKAHHLSNSEYVRRLNSCPQPTYNSALPISEKVTEIRDAIMSESVVVVTGDTGSGKSTQLPKICLQAGRGIRGFIGHTQPRRIAARSIADRISEELQTEMGLTVGYKVRFSDHTSPDSLVKLMTDGILLAELQRDRYLSEYDTIIIDEAHERSLNIDFLLGYLKGLLKVRLDLKLIITSATFDTEKFSQHFNDAPIISVEGRTYPVEVRYVLPKKEDKNDISSVVRHTVE